MTTLVTGGSGFVGSAIVLELIKRGKEVRALVRSRARPGNLAGVDVEQVEGDLLDCESLRRAVQGCDEVYHAAALYSHWQRDPSLFDRVNVQGTRNLFDVCLEHGAPRVVYTSSTAALGAHGKVPADESAQFNLESTGDHYYMSKHRAEQVALEYAAKGLPVVVVNPTNPSGPRDFKPTPTGGVILGVLKRQLPGYVDGGINLVDVDDVAVGHVRAMEKGKPGEKYIFGNTNLSLKEYFELIAEVGGGRAPSLQIPLPLAVGSAALYEAIARLTNKPPLTSMSWVKVGNHYSFWDSSKAIRELGLPQTPVRTSLQRAIEWFRAQGYLA